MDVVLLQDLEAAGRAGHRPGNGRHRAPACATSGSSSAEAAGATTSKESDAGNAHAAPGARWIETDPALTRKLLACANASDAEALLVESEAAASRSSPNTLSTAEAECLLSAALEKGNVGLAMSLYARMRLARVPTRPGGSVSVSASSFDAEFAWPPSTIASTTKLLLGLCRQIAITEAMKVVGDVRSPVPRRSEHLVGFGKVITSPLAPGRTLTVAQPQEGFKLVADAYSKVRAEDRCGRGPLWPRQPARMHAGMQPACTHHDTTRVAWMPVVTHCASHLPSVTCGTCTCTAQHLCTHTCAHAVTTVCHAV